MGQCKYCGEKGFFLSVDKDGLCRNCAPALLMQVKQSIRVIKESEDIINRSKRIDTRISRCDTILVHLKRLIELEQKGIPTLNISPSILFQQVTNERIKILSESMKAKPDSDKFIEDYQEQEQKQKQAGSINGKHYTNYVEIVEQLKRERKHDEAIKLLLELLCAVEREARVAEKLNRGTPWFIAPGYYKQLAIIYRKERRYDKEVEILERYCDQTKAPGARVSELEQRLNKAKELRDKQKSNIKL